MPRKPNFSGKAKKEYLKGKKEERKGSGRGAGFGSVVCDWGSTAVSTSTAAASAEHADEAAAGGACDGPKWTGAQLLGSGAESAGRVQRGGRLKASEAGATHTMLVQAPRNKLSTFFEREDDVAVQQRKLDAVRPLERQTYAADDAWAHVVPRPLPWPLALVDGSFAPVIPIPKRPPWRRDMTPAELEKQEQAMFVKWTESIFSKHERSALNHFEHNLEVWRQLWRAVERSDLAVFVLDARLPFFHFQQAMWDYVTRDMGREAIICINKADLVHPHVVHLWIQFFKKRMPDVPVVAFYVPKSTNRGVGQPCVEELLEAIASCRVTRNGVKVPCSEYMKDLLRPARSSNSTADQTAADDSAQTGEACSEHAAAAAQSEGDAPTDEALGAGLVHGAVEGAVEADQAISMRKPQRGENAFITACLVGDPNMGKSSLMNSLFGRKIVSSSSTPGHTKHIQTYFLSKTFCMCDAPGIVCPRVNIPRELQVCMCVCARARA